MIIVIKDNHFWYFNRVPSNLLCIYVGVYVLIFGFFLTALGSKCK